MEQWYAWLRRQLLPLDQIDAALPREGTIMDLGCGKGVIAEYLARVPTRKVIGVDLDGKRIDEANQRKTLPNLSFAREDVTQLRVDGVRGVIMSDSLHHVVPVSSHRGIFEAIHAALADDGVLVIKDVDSSELVRTKLSMLWDRILYPRDVTYYYHWRELTDLLRSVGFEATMSRLVRFFPGSTTLYVCKKAATAALTS